ncbi:MAG: RNA methyltransferase [Cypionkella sp.]
MPKAKRCWTAPAPKAGSRTTCSPPALARTLGQGPAPGGRRARHGKPQRPEECQPRCSACSASAGCTAVTPQGTWLALEDMRDPGNLGTIIRTADAVGASGIILAGKCCDPWGPDCVRATMGSIFGMPLLRMTDAGPVSPLPAPGPAKWPEPTSPPRNDYRKHL